MKLPLRTSSRVDLVRPIRAYIAENHIQDPSSFEHDITELNRLRNRALGVSGPDPEAVYRLLAYAAQLVWLTGKFPVDIGIPFSWTGSPLGYRDARTTTRSSLRFELYNILFNLAAVYYGSAASLNKTTDESLKSACNYYSLAAGVLHYMRTSLLPDLRSAPPSDLDEPTVATLYHYMLALAQESFWQKAVRNNLKDGTIAKLAAETADRYRAAAEEAGRAVSGGIPAATRHLLTAKRAQMESSARYRMSLAALDEKKYGIEVAWLMGAVEEADLALKSSAHLDSALLSQMTAAQKKMRTDLQQAERDNDLIYIEHVPPISELSPIPRAAMASSKVPPELSNPVEHFGVGSKIGQGLFSDLIPYAVTMAAEMYNEMRSKTVEQIIDDLRQITQNGNTTLAEMNLPGYLEAIEKPLGLPPSIQARADEMRQSDGVARLKREFADTESIKKKCIESLEASLQQLEAERSEDEYARGQFGARFWCRPVSEEANAELYKRAENFQQYLAVAASSDRTIGEKFAEEDQMLALLSGTDFELASYIPDSRTVELPVELSNAVVELRRQLRELSWLQEKRDEAIERVKVKAGQDEIRPALVEEARRLAEECPTARIEVMQFDDILQAWLEKYESDGEGVEREQAEQEVVLERIRESNARFRALREQHIQKNSRREVAIQALERGHFKYLELVANVRDARKFYNDLLGALGPFGEECSEFVNGRRDDALALEEALEAGNLDAADLDEGPSEGEDEGEEEDCGYVSGDGAGEERIPLRPAALPSRNVPAAAAAGRSVEAKPDGIPAVKSRLPPKASPSGARYPPMSGASRTWKPGMEIRFGPR